MSKLPSILVYLAMFNGILASHAGVLQRGTLITRDYTLAARDPTYTTTSAVISPSNRADNEVTVTLIADPEDGSLPANSSGSLNDLRVLEGALSTFTASMTTQTRSATANSFRSLEPTSAITWGATDTTSGVVSASTAASVTGFSSSTAASVSQSASPTTSGMSTNSLSTSSSNTMSTYQAATNGDRSSIGGASISTSDRSMSQDTSLEDDYGYKNPAPVVYIANIASVEHTPTPTPSVQCSYDHIEHNGNGEYVHQEGISCGTSSPSSTPVLGTSVTASGPQGPGASQTSTSALVSSDGASTSTVASHSTPVPSPSSATLDDPAEKALEWLTRSTDTVSTSGERTKIAMAEVTNVSSAGATRLRPIFW